MAKCLFRSSTSSSLINHSGIPQGSALSPSLFNIFVSDFPSQASITLSFADNFYIGESAPDLVSLTSALNDDLALVEAWADATRLTIAPEKSSVLLLIPNPHQSKTQLQVYYKGSLIPLNKNPKYLGNIADTHLNSTPHGNEVQPRLDRRVQIMKAVGGTPWGQCIELLLATYKALVRPLIDFSCPIYYPNATQTTIKHLQTTQNAALRVVT
jgi:hypothetical protein